MEKNQTLKTEDLQERLKKLRDSRNQLGEHKGLDGLSEVAKKLDEEILKVSEDLQSGKYQENK